jgi:mono/diheme cytochrome c family protein
VQKPAGSPTAASPVARGEYLAAAGGCLGCHTEAKTGAVPYAGGHALKTPFGTFYGPNITPHPDAGLGRWSEADFVRAMREGRRPDGAHYFPAFPYTSFTRIADADLRDLWAYLRSLPPTARANQPHELGFLYRWRFLLWPWKWLFFSAGPFAPDPKSNAIVNRGAYLTQALGHCGECHTPRNLMGAVRKDRYLAGSKELKAPNLTPTRLKKYGDSELKDLLTTAMTADGDVLADSMAEVVQNTTSRLTPEDLGAILTYLRSVPPLPEEARK